MSTELAQPPPAGLRGHLQLHCALDSRGRSALLQQSFRAPFHISKPHEDADALVVNIVNPTAGLLAGDRSETMVSVAEGARLVLTAPGANRAHRMRGAAMAEAVQTFRVAAGGWLEYLPELFIPQAGTRYRQRTMLQVEPGGEMLFTESLAPGRTACGEVFAYRLLHFTVEVEEGGTRVALERYVLEPGAPNVEQLRRAFATPYYASAYVLSTRLAGDAACWPTLMALHSPTCWVGCSRLASAGWIIKIVAASSSELRAALQKVRHEIYTSLGHLPPNLRRITPIR